MKGGLRTVAFDRDSQPWAAVRKLELRRAIDERPGGRFPRLHPLPGIDGHGVTDFRPPAAGFKWSGRGLRQSGAVGRVR